MESHYEGLEIISQVLWRCVLIGFLFIMFWAAMFMFAGDLMVRQCAMFGLTAHECAVLHYGGIGLYKGFILIFFLFPFVAIRLVLRKRRKS